MRDKIKGKEYFNTYIEVQEKGIKMFQDGLQDISKQDRFDIFKAEIVSKNMNILYAMYSRGDEIEVINSKLDDIINDWILLFETKSFRPPHGEIIDMISLLKLFNEEEKATKIYNEYLNEEEKDDWILNFLLCKDPQNKDNITGKIKYEKLYLPIQNLILNNNIEDIKVYMQKKWYKSHSDFAWYDRHKSSFDIYCGYWAFEIGAIVKQLNLNDECLKDVEGV